MDSFIWTHQYLLTTVIFTCLNNSIIYDWFNRYVNQVRVILCLVVRESRSLYINIYICIIVSEEFFVLTYMVSSISIKYQ